MDERRSPVGGSPESGEELGAKRRKVRKGTRSCWECKRRKIRCTFASPDDAVCDGCKRRGSSCVSQEHPEEEAPGGSARQVGDRLGRMEALVEVLVKKSTTSGLPKEISDLLPRDLIIQKDLARTSSNPSPPASASSDTDTPVYVNLTSQRSNSQRCLDVETIDGIEPTTKAAAYAKSGTFNEISRELLATWPCQKDLDIIIRVSAGTGALLHQVMSTPYRLLFETDLLSPALLLQRPTPTSHPTLIARSLLILATFLQQLHPIFNRELSCLTVPYRDIMRQTGEAVFSLVTNSDELTGSVEGVECIILESMYQANTGNLRRAWLSNRRAMVMAQLMGLHRGFDSPTVKFLHPATRKRTAPEFIWFRIIYSDRHLSLMLGLPQGSLDNSFATPAAVAADTPLGQLERLHAVAAGRILQRNESGGQHDYAVTREIDVELQQASRLMPSRWWVCPDPAECAGSVDLFKERLRLLNQLLHYSLVMQLHLPYMLRFSAEHQYDYSQMTCVSASREVLSRFCSFRSFDLVAFSCRAIDFYATIASMTLCLAHLVSHGRPGNADNPLAHQRLGDRGTVERVLENMGELGRLNADALSSKCVAILRKMLAIEADAAAGASYSTATSAEGACENLVDGNVLQLCIPYLGTIIIAKEGVSRAQGAVLQVQPDDDGWNVGPPSREARRAQSRQQERRQQQQQQLNGGEAAAPMPTGHPAEAEASSDARWHQQQQQQQAESWNLDMFVPQPGADAGGGLDPQLLGPELTAEADVWALQGMDTAYFASLMSGDSMPSDWNQKWMGENGIVAFPHGQDGQ